MTKCPYLGDVELTNNCSECPNYIEDVKSACGFLIFNKDCSFCSPLSDIADELDKLTLELQNHHLQFTSKINEMMTKLDVSICEIKRR